MIAAKLEMARQFGATHVVNSRNEENVVKAILKLTEGGADYAFECVGLGEIAAQAYGVLGKGGTAVVVGVANQKDMTSIRTASLTFGEKTLTGSYFGSARPRQDFPRLIGLYRARRLKLDEDSSASAGFQYEASRVQPYTRSVPGNGPGLPERTFKVTAIGCGLARV